MGYYIIFFGLFLFLSVLGLITFNRRPPFFLILVIGLLLILAAIFRDGADRDYLSYVAAFYNPSSTNMSFIEPSFILISNIVKYFFAKNVVFLFGIYAIFGVTLKLLGIKRLSNLYFFSLLIYLSNYFILHEMTQIRTGVATGFLLLSIRPMYNRNFFSFFFFVLLAFFFHYSAILFLPLYFLSSEKINSFFYTTLLVCTYALHFCNLHLSSLFYIFNNDLLLFKLDTYKYNILADVHVLNPIQLFRIFLAIFLLWKKDLIFPHNKYFFLLLKIYFWGICSLVLLSDISAIADRVSEIFIIVELILFPMILYTIKESIFGFSITIGISMVWICINLFFLQMLVF